VGVARGTALHFSSSHDRAALFSPLLHSHPPSSIHRRAPPSPPLFPSEPTRRTVVPAATSSTRSKVEPMAIASGMSTSLDVVSSPMSSPSPAVVCPALAPPSLRGGPHHRVAHLRPHLRRLCHRQHLVRAVTIVHIVADSLIIASPPQ
jgi:hypothetical protein